MLVFAVWLGHPPPIWAAGCNVRTVRRRRRRAESHLIPSSELIHAWLGRRSSLERVWLLSKWVFSRRPPGWPSSGQPSARSRLLVVHQTVQVDEGGVFS